MLTVTVPTAADIDAIGPAPDGVQYVAWDLLSPARADDIALATVPHYFTSTAALDALAGLQNVGAIQLPSAGYEHAVARVPEGIAICNGRGIHDDETSEFAVGLVLAALRGIDVAAREMAQASWHQIARPSLADRRVLLVGFGSIGTAIADRLAPFRVELTVVARTAREEHGYAVHAFDELETLAADAEVLILITPLTDETRHLVDARILAALPDGALVVNVARGGVVDTDALVAELATGRLAAALDVTDPEPLPAGHPLWSTPNTLITPHVAGLSTAMFPRTLALVRRQAEHLVAGEPLENVVRAGA